MCLFSSLHDTIYDWNPHPDRYDRHHHHHVMYMSYVAREARGGREQEEMHADDAEQGKGL